MPSSSQRAKSAGTDYPVGHPLGHCLWRQSWDQAFRSRVQKNQELFQPVSYCC